MHATRSKIKQLGERHQHRKDNSILRGAQILRKQLMILEDQQGDDDDELGRPIHDSTTSSPQSHSRQRRQPQYRDHYHHPTEDDDDDSTSSDNDRSRIAMSTVPEESTQESSSLSHVVQEWQTQEKKSAHDDDDNQTENDDDASQTTFTYDTQGDTTFTFDTKGDVSTWAELSPGQKEDKPVDVTHETMDSDENSSGENMLDDLFENLFEDMFDDLFTAIGHGNGNGKPSPPPPPPAPQNEGDTPETTMGRNGSLRTKSQTYIVQRVDDMDECTNDSSYYQDNDTNDYSSYYQDTNTNDSSYYQESSSSLPPPVGGALGCSYLPTGLFGKNTNTPSPRPQLMACRPSPSGIPMYRQWDDGNADSLDLLQDIKNGEEALRKLENSQELYNGVQLVPSPNNKNEFRFPAVQQQQQEAHQENVNEQFEISPCSSHVISPTSPLYLELIRDPAYQHALRAGTVWQSLVSQHVRFPRQWWAPGGPSLGVRDRRSWKYHGRHRIEANAVLNSLVHNRGSPGRILLHIVVRDLMTMQPIQDIAIGCFHPDAREIRSTSAFSPKVQDSRDIWLAVRRRHDELSVTETLLTRKGGNNKDDNSHASPLGVKKNAVHNQNMRAVFGELPPIQTIFLMENDVYEILSQHKNGPLPPSVVLIQQFLRRG